MYWSSGHRDTTSCGSMNLKKKYIFVTVVVLLLLMPVYKTIPAYNIEKVDEEIYGLSTDGPEKIMRNTDSQENLSNSTEEKNNSLEPEKEGIISGFQAIRISEPVNDEIVIHVPNPVEDSDTHFQKSSIYDPESQDLRTDGEFDLGNGYFSTESHQPMENLIKESEVNDPHILPDSSQYDVSEDIKSSTPSTTPSPVDSWTTGIIIFNEDSKSTGIHTNELSSNNINDLSSMSDLYTTESLKESTEPAYIHGSELNVADFDGTETTTPGIQHDELLPGSIVSIGKPEHPGESDHSWRDTDLTDNTPLNEEITPTENTDYSSSTIEAADQNTFNSDESSIRINSDEISTTSPIQYASDPSEHELMLITSESGEYMTNKPEASSTSHSTDQHETESDKILLSTELTSSKSFENENEQEISNTEHITYKVIITTELPVDSSTPHELTPTLVSSSEEPLGSETDYFDGKSDKIDVEEAIRQEPNDSTDIRADASEIASHHGQSLSNQNPEIMDMTYSTDSIEIISPTAPPSTGNYHSFSPSYRRNMGSSSPKIHWAKLLWIMSVSNPILVVFLLPR